MKAITIITLLFLTGITLNLTAQNGIVEATNGVILGNNTGTTDGTVRYTGTDIEGRVAGQWESLIKSTYKYAELNSLNNASYNITNQSWTAIGPTLTFTKDYDHTALELEFSGHVSIGSIPSGFGVWFEPRANGLTPSYKSRGTIKPADLTEIISCKSIYTNLAAGTYTISMYGQAPNSGASATNIVLDPGGWRAAILITER